MLVKQDMTGEERKEEPGIESNSGTAGKTVPPPDIFTVIVLPHDINDTLDDLQRFEDRRVETVEKMKVVTVLAGKSQGNVCDQGQKMVGQRSSDLIQTIRLSMTRSEGRPTF